MCRPLSASTSWPAHAVFEDITHTEITADLADIGGFPLVSEARIASDDEEPFDARQAGDDVLDHAVDEIILLGIAAHIGKRKDSDRRAVGQRQRCRCSVICEIGARSATLLDAIYAHRPGDVFDAVLAEIG